MIARQIFYALSDTVKNENSSKGDAFGCTKIYSTDGLNARTHFTEVKQVHK